MMRVFAHCVGLLALMFSSLAEEGALLRVESGEITAPLVVSNGCLWQSGSGGEAGRAVYRFTITNAGSYVLRALVNASGGDSNSFLVNIDQEPKWPSMIWDIPVTAGFTNQVVSWRGEAPSKHGPLVRKAFNLSPGEHRLIIRGDAGNPQLAGIAVVRLPPAPTGLHVARGQTP